MQGFKKQTSEYVTNENNPTFATFSEHSIDPKVSHIHKNVTVKINSLQTGYVSLSSGWYQNAP